MGTTCATSLGSCPVPRSTYKGSMITRSFRLVDTVEFEVDRYIVVGSCPEVPGRTIPLGKSTYKKAQGDSVTATWRCDTLINGFCDYNQINCFNFETAIATHNNLVRAMIAQETSKSRTERLSDTKIPYKSTCTDDCGYTYTCQKWCYASRTLHIKITSKGRTRSCQGNGCTCS